MGPYIGLLVVGKIEMQSEIRENYMCVMPQKPREDRMFEGKCSDTVSHLGT